MWPFNRNCSFADSGIFRGFTDWHSHILPGVDDGVCTMEASMHILFLYEKSGIKETWLTPHVMEDMPNTTSHLRERFSELQEHYLKSADMCCKGSVTLHLAAEYMLDRLFEERLMKEDLLPLGKKGDCLLVETSCFNPPINMQVILKRIKAKGYHPVLAHPERYVYMDWNDYLHLKENGIRFQINLPSLAGLYGKVIRDKAIRLIEKGWADCFGTDTHNLHMFQSCLTNKIRRKNIGMCKMSRM